MGVKGQLKDDYIVSILCIEDVTNLAHVLAQHHLKSSSREEILSTISDLPKIGHSFEAGILRRNDRYLYVGHV